LSTQENDSKLLNFIVLVPIISTLLYLTISTGYYAYYQMREYNQKSKQIEQDFMDKKKLIL